MLRKSGWVSIISIIFSKFSVGVRRTTSNPSYQTVVHLTPPSHYHAQCFDSTSILTVWPLMTSNDLISTRVSATESFRKSPGTNSRKNCPVFLEKFVSRLPDTSFEVCWQIGLPLPTGSALHCSPGWSTGGDNDMWSVLPRVFFGLRFWLVPI